MKVLKRFWEYWCSRDSNIFRNYWDAIGGMVVLVAIPAISIITSVYFNEEGKILGYLLPLLSIACAGLYDIYGRYKSDSLARYKLYVRLGLVLTSIVFIVISTAIGSQALSYIAPSILTVSGCILFQDFVLRIIYVVRMKLKARR